MNICLMQVDNTYRPNKCALRYRATLFVVLVTLAVLSIFELFLCCNLNRLLMRSWAVLPVGIFAWKYMSAKFAYLFAIAQLIDAGFCLCELTTLFIGISECSTDGSYVKMVLTAVAFIEIVGAIVACVAAKTFEQNEKEKLEMDGNYLL
mmetsp:Transcript_11171/g.8227  ORF Transcript_11171/g.8227 Transcript_11171/m.8227 type:complete len:149 (+) Transcript_11171:49-495(+)